MSLESEQLESGEFYGTIKPAIVISIVCGTLFPNTEKAHTVYRYKERDLNFELTNKSEFHFLELDKIDVEKPVEEMTPLERFGAYVRYAADPERREYIQSLLNCGEEVISMTDKMLKRVSEDDQVKEWQRARDIFLMNQRCLMWEATQEGLEKGLEKGLEQGIAAFILDNLEDQKTEEQIIAKLVKRFSLNEDKARAYLAGITKP